MSITSFLTAHQPILELLFEIKTLKCLTTCCLFDVMLNDCVDAYITCELDVVFQLNFDFQNTQPEAYNDSKTCRNSD